ncbi:MAG: hypothetical protein IKE94_06350 [Aeriscardovia sp.]|nr:hypothetical protein [Aeriscardovia sp.]
MNGIEALKALKEGHTVAHISANRVEIDRYYRFSTKEKKPGLTPPVMWFRWAHEWIWKESNVDVTFWLLAEDDDFEIVEGVN